MNDIWGLKYDEKIADVIAKHNVACCLMHNRDNTEYSNFLDDFMEDMRECIRLAKAAGVADDKKSCRSSITQSFLELPENPSLV